MFYVLYSLISIIILPIYIAIIIVRIFLRKESFRSVYHRFAQSTKKRPDGKLIWIHAASVGESKVAETIIDALSKRDDSLNFLITTTTLTSADIINSWNKDNYIHHFTPIDSMLILKMFFAKWKPDLGIFIESELWPGLVIEGSENCKLLLVNSRLSDRSFRRWSRFQKIFQVIAKNFVTIITQSDKDQKKYGSLGVYNTKNLGNLKFANAKLISDHAQAKKLQNIIGKRKIIVAASTHSKDEEILVPILRKLFANKENLFAIIVPRHPARVKEIINLCEYYKIKFSVSSSAKYPKKQDQLFLVDSFGVLGTMFEIADLVFIGGSFGRGGHNLLEPAGFGCAILCGPDMTNCQNITDEMLEKNAAIQIQDKNGLEDKICYLLSDEGLNQVEEMSKNAMEYIEGKEEVLKKYIDEIKHYV